MDGVISLPIATAGFFMIPDLPENSRAWYLTKDQIAMAQKRMADIGRAPRTKLVSRRMAAESRAQVLIISSCCRDGQRFDASSVVGMYTS